MEKDFSATMTEQTKDHFTVMLEHKKKKNKNRQTQSDATMKNQTIKMIKHTHPPANINYLFPYQIGF